MHIMNILPVTKYFSVMLLVIIVHHSISRRYYIQAHVFDYLHHYKYLAIIYNYAVNILEAKPEHNCNYIFCILQRRFTLLDDVLL